MLCIFLSNRLLSSIHLITNFLIVYLVFSLLADLQLTKISIIIIKRRIDLSLSNQNNTSNKRKADINDETQQTVSEILSAQNSGSVGSNNGISSTESNDLSEDLITQKFKTTYEYFLQDDDKKKWICQECRGCRIREYSANSSKSTLDGSSA